MMMAFNGGSGGGGRAFDGGDSVSIWTGSHPSWRSLLHFYLFLVHFYGVVDFIHFHC